jgi:hypothetical protein
VIVKAYLRRAENVSLDDFEKQFGNPSINKILIHGVQHGRRKGVKFVLNFPKY